MKNDFQKAMISGGDRRRVISVLDGLSTTLKDVEDLMNQYFDRQDKDSPDFVKRINLLSFIQKVLEVNIRFLRDFAGTSSSQEPVISAALARGIFELHLILLEATSDDTSFYTILTKAGCIYESFIEKFLQIAEQKGDVTAINTFQNELVRVALLKKNFEKLLKAGLKSGAENCLYLNFKELAKKHGLSDVYDIEYSLLSSFIHPSLLYLITTESRDKTVSEERRQLAKLNVEGRKRSVKRLATNIALDLSFRTTSKVRKVLDDYTLALKG
jgi:hypothetical protein